MVEKLVKELTDSELVEKVKQIFPKTSYLEFLCKRFVETDGEENCEIRKRLVADIEAALMAGGENGAGDGTEK